MNNPTPQQIKALRIQSKLTQTEFGDLVYVNLRTVQRWEKGDMNLAPIIWEFYLTYFHKQPPRLKS